jgi:two-component system, NtrC family, nitrogen regulation sensor histidine kinase GlnL
VTRIAVRPAPERIPARPDASSQLAAFAFPVILLDPDNRVVEANPAAEALLGWSAARMAGRPLEEVVRIEDSRVAAHWQGAAAPLVARDVPLTTETQTRRVILTSSPVQGHAGWRTIALIETGPGGGEDSEVALRAPAILAHEIKNPLAAIRGAGQLLARRLGPRDQSLAVLIAQEVDRIAGLIDRMEQLGGPPRADPARCNLHEAIRSALASIRAARGAEIELAEAFDPSLPAVLADRAMLEQVMINLVANALDACAEVERPRVEVRTRFVSGLVYNVISLGKTRRLPVEIVVTDNGPGIPPELRDRVFEPFVSGRPRGQGLGLALVRKLVLDMGGRIAHDRNERLGLTSFRIALAMAPTGAP